MADPGEKAGGGAPLISRPNQEPMTKLRREGLKKKKLEIGQPPYLRVWIAAPLPPPLSQDPDPALVCSLRTQSQ